MTYKESLDWLFSQLPMFSRVGAAAYKPGLNTVLALARHFGDPQQKFRSIHIAGTNGKGSTSHMIAAMLQAQGYKTALYTSPHLVDFRERIRINGAKIPEEEVTRFVSDFRTCGYEGRPSFFELTMMMAFKWFADEEVDYAVIEVGMGGRLDSTNIIIPEMSVITNISWDHTQFLGDTLPKIAGEKAGIMKPGGAVVIGEAEGEVRRVFEQRAKEVGSEIVFAEDHPCLQGAKILPAGGIECDSTVLGHFRSDLSGEYQLKNINTVLTALEVMRRRGIEVSDKSAREGLSHTCDLTGLAGRWQRLGERPLVICDTGHNEAGLSYNMHHLSEIMKSHPGAVLHIVMGFVADKAVDHILPLFPRDARYYLSNAAIPRALPVDQLREVCRGHGIEGEAYKTVREAYDAALASCSPEDVVYVGGSTFIVADLLVSLQ